VDSSLYLKTLYPKLLSSTLNSEELAWLQNYFDSGDPETLLKLISAELWSQDDMKPETAAEQQIFSRIYANIEAHQIYTEKAVKKPIRLWIQIAAILFLVIGAGLFYNNNKTKQAVRLTSGFVNDIPSGTNSATLTLANGKQIILSGTKTGELAKEAGVNITKTADGQLVYSVNATAKSPSPDQIQFNTLSTKNGETYQIHLPDGTSVWLNAGSSLKYPTTFTTATRLVELSGEGYFEVAKDKAHPFIVSTGMQQITVLGTHFNVNAYADEPDMKTTLLEGSIKLELASKTDGIVLKPGQQASVKSKMINVTEVNPDAAVDWKNGKFRFKNESLKSIMRKVSRWYNVEIVYLGDQQELTTFSGSVSRFDKVSAVLKMLEETSDVKFSIEGRTIKVQ
jgi:transmembrane sensor